MEASIIIVYVIFCLLLAGIIIGGGVYVFYTQSSSQSTPTQNTQPTNTPAPTDYSTQWTCLTGTNVPVRLNNAGDVQCSATDGKNCLWANNCDINSLPKEVNPLTCGSVHKGFYGSTGYNDTNHWCNKSFKLLKAANTPVPSDLAN